ncbi:FAD/NAD(P)-binding protein [Lysobacter terrae]
MRITIIGAGFCGSALAIELARNAKPQVDICLVGINGNFARGVAYGDARPEHLLNVRARQLGLKAEIPGDFADWLCLTSAARDRFLPRLAYGEYLRARLAAASELTEATLACVEQEVIAVERLDRGFRLHFADGGAQLSDQVVLAIGALPPQALAGVGPALTVHPSYVAWPWREGAIDRIDTEASVLIVGTGLTMADVVVTLRRRGHTGPIHALSRHGLLPCAHSEEPSPPISLPPAILHALNQRDLRLLLSKLRSLAQVVPDWRSLVDAVRPYLQDFWRGLPMPDRARFLRHVRPYWERVRHRIAPAVAEEIETLLHSGQLRVSAGRLLRARRRDGAIAVSIRERGRSEVSVERYDVLIRATGLDTDVERTPDPLISNLREAGLLAADPLGLGLQTTEHFNVVDRAGQPVEGLYAVGPLLRSGLWEITAVAELRVAVNQIARSLLHEGGFSAHGEQGNLMRYPQRAWRMNG